MLPLDDDADLNDYPVDYRNLVYELNKNSTWITAATYIAKKIQILGNPWLRQLEQEGNCSKSPGDLLLIKLKRLDLCKVGKLCEIFQECDLPDALYIVYGPVPMELDEHLYCSSNGKITNEVAFGDTFCLTCEASGLPPPRYQWFHGNFEMPYETSSTLTLLISSPDQEGEYQCRVKQYNRDEVCISEEFSRCATLNIKPTVPEIIKQPVSVSVKLGEVLCLSCKAESHPIPNYQWYKDNKFLNGKDSDTLRIKKFKPKDKGKYYCIVSNIALMKGIKSYVSVVTVDHPPQTATRKIALLIANRKYKNYDEVPKAEDDAIALAGVLLEKMNFQVRCLRNLTLRSMRTEIKKFGEMLDEGDYGLFYFGGHGFATDSDFMMPIDAPDSNEIVYDDNFSGHELMYHLQQKKFAALAIIKDTCQWQPTENEMPKLHGSTRTHTSLTYIQKTETFHARSTCPGSLSHDPVEGTNGVYMSHVLKHISSDKPIHEVFSDIAQSVRESASKVTKDQKPEVKYSPVPPYRHLTDAVVASRGIPLEVGSPLDQFINFKPNTVTIVLHSVFRADGTSIPNGKVVCRVTVQPLKEPFLNDILLTVSGLDDWEVKFELPRHEQVKIVSMNLGECHIFNNIRRVAPDNTKGLVGMRITRYKGTKYELTTAGELPYLEWVPRILKDVWLA